jgi:ethanolamine utilization protein EutN
VILADVIGTVVSPVQIPVLDGHKLLLLKPVSPSGDPAGQARIGIDTIGAGVGDRVLVIQEGNSARLVLDEPQGAVKTVIIGFVDEVEIGGEIVFDHARP